MCRGALSLLGGLLLWEWVARYLVKSTLIIVPPSDVGAAFAELLAKGELQTHVYVSGFEFVVGFALAAVVGIGTGMAIGVSDAVRDVLEPWLSALYATPVIAFAPLFLVWMGPGHGVKPLPRGGSVRRVAANWSMERACREQAQPCCRPGRPDLTDRP